MSDLEIKIENFRKEAEDLIRAVVLQYYFDNSELQNPYAPYDDVQDALDNIGDNWRPYMTVNVNGTEMWFIPNGDLVNKVGNLSLEDGSVSLSKMANVDSGTVFYRKSAGSGPPEVQTLQTLADDLGIAEIPGLIPDLVEKEEGKSLVLDELIAMIHEPGSDDQDLSNLVEKQEGFRLISEGEAEQIKQNVFTIMLPASSSVAGRVSAAQTEDYPDGWTIQADSNPIDFKVIHGLERRIAHVSVFSVDGSQERLLLGNAAYSGVYAPDNEILVIESLATINTPIVIHLIFA